MIVGVEIDHGTVCNPLSAWQPSQQESRLFEAISGRVWLLTVEIFTLVPKTNFDEYSKEVLRKGLFGTSTKNEAKRFLYKDRCQWDRMDLGNIPEPEHT